MKTIPAVPAKIRSLTQAARLVPARLRHGRPWRLAARTGGGFMLAEIAFHSGAGPAAITGTMAGITIWLAFTIRADLAPPPAR
jgi:hypothetical protein